MNVKATKKNVLEALQQMHLYGAIERWAEPLPGVPRWAVWTGQSTMVSHLTGAEILAMNTGVCAALSAVMAGRSVQDGGMFLRADLAAKRGAWDGGQYVVPAPDGSAPDGETPIVDAGGWVFSS